MLRLLKNNRGHGVGSGWGYFLLAFGGAILTVILAIVSIILSFVRSRRWLFGLIPFILVVLFVVISNWIAR